MDSDGTFEITGRQGSWTVTYNGDVIASGYPKSLVRRRACKALGITLQAMCDKYEDLWQVLMDYCGGPQARKLFGRSKAEAELAALEEQFTPAEEAFLEDFFAAVEEVDDMRKNLERVEFL